MIRKYWMLDLKLTVLKPNGTEEVTSNWERLHTEFATLEDAIKDFIRNRCQWELRDKKKLEISKEPDGTIILKGRTLMINGMWPAPKTREEEWERGKTIGCEMTYTYGKISFINEDQMNLEECQAVGRKLGCI